MTEATATGSGPVFRLIYRSRSLVSSAQRRAVLGEIFATARRNNRTLGVTGALMISEDGFVQALEGDETVVRDLYATISGDGRHHHVSVLEEGPAERRAFGRWAMAQVSTDSDADIRLRSNAAKGVLVALPGRDQPATAEQETILASMRASLALDHA